MQDELNLEMKKKTVRSAPIVFEKGKTVQFIEASDTEMEIAEWSLLPNQEIISDALFTLFNEESGSIQINDRFSNEEWTSKLEEVAEKHDENLEKLAK